MRSFILSLVLSVVILPVTAKQSRAYDMDCAIMLCMAGGFPSSAVCAAAYAEMIRRITPWPVRPPFGICTFAAVPIELGGPGGEGELDISIPEYAWLRKTRVLWFYGRSYESRDDPRQWDWYVRSCDHENRYCRYHVRVFGSHKPWPESFVSENGQSISFPSSGGRFSFFHRAVMVEYGDYEGNMDHSEWFRY
ncbi:hypothetical protein [Shimia sp. FJ5]|uniref:hypothetical protein n=1 Tax=Shimia sp. FJ5 TaxID=3079054 RepID=UPI00262805C5|nr:hypothetical protein [Shimia sp. FJ5]MDV4146645.1 hypothetical protein [Shimia sp. FJ5]